MLVGYTRISTNEQNTDLQINALINYGVDKRHIFQDTASGSIDTRIGLGEAINFLAKGDTLVVWRLDRLGRSLKHLIEIIVGLQTKGIKFVSLTENIDTTTSTGQLFFHIFGAIAEFERNLIKERVKAGLEASRLKGIKGGRPRAISEEKMVCIKEAIRLGTPRSVICRNFGIKRSTLFDSLKQQQY